MKKVLALLLASLMVFSLAACSKDKSRDDFDDDLVIDDGDVVINEDGSGESNADNSDSDLRIVHANDFSDGVAMVNTRSGVVAIDTTGAVLFEAKEIDNSRGNILYSYYYQNGIMVVDDVIWDKTGKVIASPELNGYDTLLTGSCNGYVLAYKAEETSSGTQQYIGVLNNKGEWEQPLSADNPLVKACGEESLLFTNLSVAGFSNSSAEALFKINDKKGVYFTRYYNAITNEVTKDYDHYTTYYNAEESGIWRQEASGESTEILASLTKAKNLTAKEEWFFENAFVGVECQETSYKLDVENGVYKIYDYSGNVVTDLSGYKLNEVRSYVNGYLLATVDNGDDTESLCLFTPSGEPAFEPIKMGAKDCFYDLDEEGFVYCHTDEATNKDTYRFYDYSGNTVEYTGITHFSDFSDGLALVKGENGMYSYINHQGETVIKYPHR